MNLTKLWKHVHQLGAASLKDAKISVAPSLMVVARSVPGPIRESSRRAKNEWCWPAFSARTTWSRTWTSGLWLTSSGKPCRVY